MSLKPTLPSSAMQQQYVLPYVGSPTQVTRTTYTAPMPMTGSFVVPGVTTSMYPQATQGLPGALGALPGAVPGVPRYYNAAGAAMTWGSAGLPACTAGTTTTQTAAKKSQDSTPFGGDIHLAAKAGDINAVRQIQRAKPHSVHMADETGQMPLHHAVAQGHLQMINELLSCGADIEATNHDGDTPLHHGISEGNAEVVRLLLDKRADLHAKEKFVGGTPLHHAALHGRLDVVKVLLQRKPNLEAENRKGQTPLHVAALYSQLETAHLLLGCGANAKAIDAQGNTPAALAKKTGHRDMEDVILEAA